MEEIIIAFTQGITELFPISSSAHLFLLKEFFNFNINLNTIIFLHFWAAIGITLGLLKEIKDIFLSKEKTLIFKNIIISLIPISLLGFFFFNFIENNLQNSTTLILINLIFWGMIMIVVEKYFFKKDITKIKLENISLRNAIYIGIAQIIALIPGTSRSGITILAGIVLGVRRKTAIIYSFIISIPLTILIFLFQILKTENIYFSSDIFILGLFTTLCAFFGMIILKRISNKRFFTFFGIYRIVIAIMIILYYI